MSPRRNLERLRRETGLLILEELELPVVRPVAALDRLPDRGRHGGRR